MSLLAVRNLEVHYDRLRAVEDVSFDVAEGEIVALVGPNGAGKSTTLLTVAGALKPASRGPAHRRREGSTALLLAPRFPWLRPPMPRNRLRISTPGD